MEILTNFILPMAVAVFASTGFWGWVSTRKNTNKDILDKLESIGKNIEDIDYKVERNEAISCRARLLRYNKELINKERHTHEEFSQALEDIDKYEAFCTKHPEFQNSKAVLSIANIRRCYEKCEQDGDFL